MSKGQRCAVEPLLVFVNLLCFQNLQLNCFIYLYLCQFLGSHAAQGVNCCSLVSSLLSSATLCYTKELYEQLLYTLNFLWHTRQKALIYRVDTDWTFPNPFDFKLLTDADYGESRDDMKSMKSTTGCFGFRINCLIFAHCKHGSLTATSSAMSETDGVFESWKYARFVHNWCLSLRLAFRREQILYMHVLIFSDCEAVIAILSKYVNTSKVKHFDVKVYAVRDDITNKFIELIHIERGKNIADILTHYMLQKHS